MKKIIYMVFFVCLFIPFKIKAINIDSLNMNGASTVKNGEKINITLEASTSNYQVNEGIWWVYTNLVYNKEHLILEDITSPNYKTVIQYSEDGALLVSEVIEGSNGDGMCVNELLHCGTVKLVLKFHATDVTKPIDTSISISEFGVGTIIINEVREYTLDDMLEAMYPDPIIHYLKLKPNVTIVENKPVTVPEEKTTTESSKKATIPVVVKSSNNNLSKLEIKDYKLDFDKNTTSYSLNIDEKVNNLNIKPVSEHSKSSYKITGNDDLKDGSVVKIIVTAEDGKTKEYKINITKEEKVISETGAEKIVEVNKEEPKQNYDDVNKNIIIAVSGIVGVFIIIGIICLISNIRDNRKLDKLTNEMD